jgi:hypothetical protein
VFGLPAALRATRAAPPLLAVLVMLLLAGSGCVDALLIDESEATGDLGIGVQLQGLPAAGGAILTKVNQLRVRFTRPGGSFRDTTFAIPSGEGAGRARLRVGSEELVTGLVIEATLMASQTSYYRGRATLDLGPPPPSAMTIEMGPIVGSMAIVPPSVKFTALSDSVGLRGIGRFPSGEVIPDAPMWSSSNPEIVAVTAGGTATAMATGGAVLEARYGPWAAVAHAFVRQAAARVNQVVPERLTLHPGESASLRIVGEDHNGHALLPGSTATWTVQPAGLDVASVTASGGVLARGGGSVTVTARGLSGEASAAIEVVPRTAPGPSPLVIAGPQGIQAADLAGLRGALVSFGGATGITRSPDGKWLAFVRDGLLYICDIGGQVRQLDGPKTATWPEFSADGEWIYFSNIGPGGVDEVYRVHPDGLGLQIVARYALMPTAAPDGKRLAYVRDRDLVVQDLGGDAKVILAAVDPVTPTWSPDGGWIAFLTGSSRTVALVRPDGTDLRYVEAVGLKPGISWSPDGAWLIGSDGWTPSVITLGALEMMALPWNSQGEVAWWR